MILRSAFTATRTDWLIFFFISCCSIALGAVTSPTTSSGYRVVQTIPIPGDGGWDFLTVDSVSRRLYVTHETHVVVMDIDSMKLIGDIPETRGVHGVVLAPELGRGFTSNGKANTSTIFDLKTLKVIGTAKTSEGPDGIVYEPISKRVFTFNHHKDITVINARDGSVVTTLDFGGRVDSAVADGKGSLFATVPQKSEVIEFDGKKMSLVHTWPIPCELPSPIAMDTANRRLFVACDNRLLVMMNADTGKVLTTAPIGPDIDGADYDPSTRLAFAASEAGSLAVVHEETPDTFSSLSDIVTKPGARTLAIDRQTHRIFLATAVFDPPLKGEERPRIRPNTLMVVVLAK
jgi:DNA-binding beta-propeller fold protein YncE